MIKNTYIVATIRPWNIRAFRDVISHYPGKWYLITDPKDLTPRKVKAIAPRYIFFPHWSHIVPKSVLDLAECVCFHETDLPFGRGGSPIQNLIVRGHKATKITALKMTEALDAGPVYMKRGLTLQGSAEEIFIRASGIVAKMIHEIVTQEPSPAPQKGRSTMFQRRKPEQSRVTVKTMEKLFDHLRMLDAEGYPRAFIEHGGFRFEFSRAALRTGAVEAAVRIIPCCSRRKI